MPNTLDATGLTIKTTTEVINDLVASLQSIYGPDINVDSNSPDGQLVNIFAQAVTDILELLMDTYNSFSVENAYGVLLDQRVALNGLARKQGTYTVTNVTVTVDRALTLAGRDALEANPAAQVYTVADDEGNEFQLLSTHVFGGAGSAALEFQASELGRVETLPNTLINQVTTTLGVTSVNNPTAATGIGVNEETDAQLRARHAESFSLAATGPADSVEAALKETAGVTDAYVVENTTDATVSGTPAHSIWTIVTGGAPADIAQAIYSKKGIGCGMRGAQSYSVARQNGNNFVALWDTSIPQPLYIHLTVQPRVAGAVFDASYIQTQLAAALSYKLGQSPTIGDVITALLAIAPDGYLIDVGVSSEDATFLQVVSPTDAQHYFTVSSSDIDVTV